jgi:ATP-dependent protease HslVU (ClpYQ) ATPase subunit
VVEEKILLILTGPHAREDAKRTFRNLLRTGGLNERTIDVEVPANQCVGVGLFGCVVCGLWSRWKKGEAGVED